MAMLLLDGDMFGLADGRTPQTPPLDVLGHREWGGGAWGKPPNHQEVELFSTRQIFRRERGSHQHGDSSCRLKMETFSSKKE